MSNSRNDAFQRALDETRRQDQAPRDDPWWLAAAPRVRASLELGRARDSGGKARFGLASDWANEPADQPGPQASGSIGEEAPAPRDTADAIAVELGIAEPLTTGELASRWREFVWRNHPDRQPASARERANARVAIANMLYDRARRERGAAR